MRYENGEEDVVDIKRVEPTGDYEAIEEGQTVCCKGKSGRYEAHVLQVIEDSSGGPKVNVYNLSVYSNP